MIIKPQKMANNLTVVIAQVAEAKKAIAVVSVVKNIALRASGRAWAATYSVDFVLLFLR